MKYKIAETPLLHPNIKEFESYSPLGAVVKHLAELFSEKDERFIFSTGLTIKHSNIRNSTTMVEDEEGNKLFYRVTYKQ